MALLNGDKVAVSFRGTCFGQRIIMTRTYRLVGAAPGGNTIAQDQTYIGNVFAAGGAFDLEDFYLDCLPPEYTLNEIRVQCFSPVRTALTAVARNVPGTNANSATVANDAAAITLRGSFGNRHNIGGVRLGPVPDAASAAGLLTAGYLVDTALLAAKLITQASLPAWGGAVYLQPILWDKATSQAVDVVSASVQPQSRVNRRRTVGLGE